MLFVSPMQCNAMLELASLIVIVLICTVLIVWRNQFSFYSSAQVTKLRQNKIMFK